MRKNQRIKFIKNGLKSLMNKLPYVKTLHQLNSNSKFPNGHYYSTVVSLEKIKLRQNEIWKSPITENIEGIDLRIGEQLQLVEKLTVYYPDIPFTDKKQEKLRYYFNNSYYSHNDGLILYSIIRHFKPKNIIEIGSGYSSAVMMDTNELFLNGNINLTFIEPYAGDRLNALMTETDKKNTTLIQEDVQLVPLDVFKNLKQGDILFIDSTHAVKTGSDINYILFEILPVLSKGVLIHFHDIYFPFEYPKSWVLDGFGWNEAYFLKAFLMYNMNFKIVLFSDYLSKFHKEAFQDMPEPYKSNGSNLWIEKN